MTNVSSSSLFLHDLTILYFHLNKASIPSTHQSELSFITFKSASYLVYPGQNSDVGEILRNLIGCLGHWNWKSIPRIGVLKDLKNQPKLLDPRMAMLFLKKKTH